MPFTVDGEWIPSKTPNVANKPVKVRLNKRGKNVVTSILNLAMTDTEMDMLASRLKKKLGCGGARKEDTIEVQGDKVTQVKQFLLEIGIKSQ